MKRIETSNGIQRDGSKGIVRTRRDSQPLLLRGAIPILTLCIITSLSLFVIPLFLDAASASGKAETLWASADQDAAEPAPTPVPEASPASLLGHINTTPALPDDDAVEYAALRAGDSGDRVTLIQQRLMELEYVDSDEPGVEFNDATEAALKLFQRVHYMLETGIADSLTQSVLFSDSAKIYLIEKGNEGDDVTLLQNRLSELGYYEGKTNGYFGVATQRALTSFQDKNGIDTLGIADRETRDILYSPKAKSLIEEMPEPEDTRQSEKTPGKTPGKMPEKSSEKMPERDDEIASTPYIPEIPPDEIPEFRSTPRPDATQASDESDEFDESYEPEDTPAPGDGSDEPEPTPPPDDESDEPEQTPSPTRTPAPEQTDTPVNDGGVSGFISVAMEQEGKPYIYSTEGPSSFDCSGLVYYCLKAAGVNTRRYSAAGFSEVGSWETVSSTGDLERGDLLFFRSDSSARVSHTGIWLGGSKYIHASSSAGRVIVSDWSSWSRRNFLMGKRVF